MRSPLFAVVALLALGACERSAENPAPPDPEAPPPANGVAPGEPTMGDRAGEVFRDVTETAGDWAEQGKDKAVELGERAARELDEQIESLRSRAGTLPEDTRDAASDAVSDLERGLEQFRELLTELKDAASDQWAKIAPELQDAAAELRESIRETAERFNLR